MASWNTAKHQLFTSRLLTKDDPRAPNPPGFEGRLYPPQATLLHAMLEIERRPMLEIEVEGGRPPEDEDSAAEELDRLLRPPGPTGHTLIRAQRALIGEKFSFGKTVLALALHLAAKEQTRRGVTTPCRRPSPISMLSMDAPTDANRACVSSSGYKGRKVQQRGCGYLPEIRAHFSRFLSATLVIAQASVISEWEDNIARFAPGLRHFVIENVHSLRRFQTIYRSSSTMDGIELVLVKIGRVTGNFVVPGEPPVKKEGVAHCTRAMTEALARVTEHTVWERVLYDDFDTLKLTSADHFLPALSTWIISATRRTTRTSARLIPGGSPAEFLRANGFHFPILGAALDDITYGCLTLRCDPDYVHEHISSTVVQFRRITVKGGRAAQILENLGVPAEVVEAVNAGAFRTAAEHFSIVASTPGEIIAWVLKEHTEKYRRAARVIARISEADGLLCQEPHQHRAPMDKEAAKELREALKKGTELEVRAALSQMGGPSAAITKSLESLQEWAEGQMEQYGQHLTRLRGNVQEQQCQSCMVPHEKDHVSYILNGCCHIVICEYCTVEEPRPGVRQYIKKCPNCAAPVDVQRDLIYVGKEIDLEKTLDNQALLEPQDAKDDGEEEESLQGVTDEEDEKLGYGDIAELKLRALAQLLEDAKVDCVSDEKLSGEVIPGLIEGRRNSPAPDDHPQKWLVFGHVAETTRNISALLTDRNIPHLILRGTVAQKTTIKRQFRDDPRFKVLIVTATKDCSGMHLPFVTHTVFTHRVIDPNIEAQAAGRAQRTGRTHNLEIIQLWNEAEARGEETLGG